MSVRIQSVFLVLAALINLATFVVPMWQISNGSDTELITALQSSSQTISGTSDQSELFFEHPEPMRTAAHSLFLGLSVLASLLLIYTIYAHHDKSGRSRLTRQIRFGYISIGIIAAEILVFIWLTSQGPALILGSSDQAMAHFGFTFPIVAIVLTWLAIRKVSQTQKMITSDRLR
ncbi:MAG: DUF4293 family protein [Bacteroidota bacterium]